jgi:glutathione synthase/RimK-type ligase-like ATP-grasp enzyme
LIELAARGVPVTPTELLSQGWNGSLTELCRSRGWPDVVVKPAVGAASFETYRYTDINADVDAQVRGFASQRDLLVQPYLPSVEDHGERALVWIDGEFTHAVRKTPRFAGGVEVVSEAIGISPAERALGEAALAPFAAELLYARVDVAPGFDGQPVVMELELIEPSLFLLQSPLALARLVAAVRRELVRPWSKRR